MIRKARPFDPGQQACCQSRGIAPDPPDEEAFHRCTRGKDRLVPRQKDLTIGRGRAGHAEMRGIVTPINYYLVKEY